MEKFNCGKCGRAFEVDINNDIVCCPSCGNMNFPETKLRAGFNINGFELVRKIGSGAMGTVWLAKQTSMQRNVALKILSPSVCTRKGFIERFQGEIKNSAKLDHPNIVQAFDAGYRNGFYYLASAFVDGESLEEKLIKSGRISEKAALQIAVGIAEALSYAWSEFNMLHRDIKPSNIIIDKKNIPKLMDMGLSKCINEDPSLTYDGEIVGTPYYMSPEQAKGKTNLDLKSDIYSLGATLYHSITGKLPFDGTSSVGILTKHITEPLVPPIERFSSISQEANELIVKMMEKQPDNRIQSWYEVIGEIRNILEKSEAVKEVNTLKLKKEEYSENNSIVEENNLNSDSPYEVRLKQQEKEILKEREKDKYTNELKSRKKKTLIHVIYSIVFLIFSGLLIYFAYNLFFKEISGIKVNLKFFYSYTEKIVNDLFFQSYSLVQIYLFNKTKVVNPVHIISLKSLGIDLLLVLVILFSGFWSGAKAQKANKNCVIHFLGGLFVPFIYPLFVFNINSSGIKKDNSGTEIPEKKIVKYFKKSADKYKEINSCFEFELYDDSRLYAEHVIEVKDNMLVLQVYTDKGDSKVLRVPYSRIKNYTKLQTKEIL